MFLRILQIAIPFIWFGMIGAISFMEAPLKFQAPGITLAEGLSIGRLVFFVLNKIEIVFAVLMSIALFTHRPKKTFPVIGFAIILVLLALETLWLLPALDVRAEQVIAGTAEPYSSTHLFYIAFDAVKFLLLFAVGISLTKPHLRFD
jgi:hypothetical protein